MPKTLNDNQFFTGLVNLAIFMRQYATNTSRKINGFVDAFTTETIGYGDTKIFPFSDLPEVSDYSGTSTLLDVSRVKTNEEFIEISQRKLIKSSYSTQILTSAFMNESGMNGFIGYILGQMDSAKTKWLYEQLTDVIQDNYFATAPKYANGQAFKSTQVVNVPIIDTSSLTDPAEINDADLLNQKNIAKALQYEINNISVFSDNYNCGGTDGTGYQQALETEDMRFIFLDPYKTDSVIDLMATLLNSEYVSEDYSKPDMLTIPKISIKEGSTAIGVLMHKSVLQLFYKFTIMGSFFDTSNLVVNNFLHFWYGLGDLKNLPIIVFKANTSTVDTATPVKA